MISEQSLEHMLSSRREEWLLDTVLENSYKNFHAKGFDYLCLKRTPELTLKAYFFEGDDVAKLPEVVMPHDHRYAFHTYCLSGAVEDRQYTYGCRGVGDPCERYDEFCYYTPLNGGNGFEWNGEAHLMQARRIRRPSPWLPSRAYFHLATDIHTIEILQPDTVLLLAQFADEKPVGEPTRAFRKVGSKEPPNLDGLYEKMDADHALKRVRQLRSLMGVPADA